MERAIRYVRDSFWAGRTFTTLAECNRQAGLWRDQIAHQRRGPGGDDLTVAEAFQQEQLRLLPPAQHPFPTDRLEPVTTRKTIYVRFDLNGCSLPPEAVGRSLTLAASATVVRVRDGAVELARHVRSDDRHRPVLDPAHQDAVVQIKRKRYYATPGGRLEPVVPESRTLLDQAFAQGESAGSPTAQWTKLGNQYGPSALGDAIQEALQRGTPRAWPAAFLLRRQPRPAPQTLDLSRHPHVQDLPVRPVDLHSYDELAQSLPPPGSPDDKD